MTTSPLRLSAASSARPLVLLAVWAYGLGTRQSAVWVAAAVLLFLEGLWWASSARTAKGHALPVPLVLVMAFGSVALGPLRSLAWLLVLSAEWLVRPALWDGGVLTHARRRRASRQARKIRAASEHVTSAADGVALAAHAASVEMGNAPRRRWFRRALPPPPAPVPESAEVQARAQPVGMRFVQGVVHEMSDGSTRWEELANEA